jgi:hypothetical protein
MDMLVGAFGHAAANDGEVLFPVRSGGMRVNERGLAGAQIAIADDTGFHFGRSHVAPFGG